MGRMADLQPPSPEYERVQLVSIGAPATLSDGTAFPAAVTFVMPPAAGDGLLLEGVVGVVDGRPILIRLASTRVDGGEITGTVLRAVNVTAVTEAVVRRAAELASSLDAISRLQPGAPFRIMEDAPRAGETAAAYWARRPPTDELLHQVANIVRNNPFNPRKEVASQLHMSERTASRRIAEAKARGFLADDIEEGNR